MAAGTPIYPFENPAHALGLAAFGIVYWLLAKAISYAANAKGLNMVPPEYLAHLGPRFWTVYGSFGKIGQWIGLTVASLGAVGFIFSLFNWLF